MADFVDAFARAIARQEGFYRAGSKARRLNNPGNLRPWRNCPLPVADGMIVFPSAEAGWEQLRAQIRLNIRRGLTTRQFFGGKGTYPGYAPRADKNQPDAYAAFVAAQVGILPVPGLAAVDRVLVDVIATWHQEPHLSAAQREE